MIDNVEWGSKIINVREEKMKCRKERREMIEERNLLKI